MRGRGAVERERSREGSREVEGYVAENERWSRYASIQLL